MCVARGWHALEQLEVAVRDMSDEAFNDPPYEFSNTPRDIKLTTFSREHVFNVRKLVVHPAELQLHCFNVHASHAPSR
jgi:hypothetical protein